MSQNVLGKRKVLENMGATEVYFKTRIWGSHPLLEWIIVNWKDLGGLEVCVLRKAERF